MATKKELLDFLDHNVFDKILHARDEKHSHGTKHHQELEDVKKRTEAEKARFYGYDSAERIVAMFKDDLTSENAKPVNARLQDLGLPRLVDVKDQFLKLAGEDQG